MAQLSGILHVNLTIAPGSQALEEARQFYVDVLGLEVLPRPEQIDEGRPGWWLACGNGQQIHISAEPEAAHYNGGSGRHAAFQVNNLSSLQAKLEQAGYTIIDAEYQPHGMQRCFVRDPWGNRLEFVELN